VQDQGEISHLYFMQYESHADSLVNVFLAYQFKFTLRINNAIAIWIEDILPDTRTTIN
jgi:hypothetical protein